MTEGAQLTLIKAREYQAASQRLLVLDSRRFLLQTKILEVSPSGEFVNLGGGEATDFYIGWTETAAVRVIEELAAVPEG